METFKFRFRTPKSTKKNAVAEVCKEGVHGRPSQPIAYYICEFFLLFGTPLGGLKFWYMVDLYEILFKTFGVIITSSFT